MSAIHCMMYIVGCYTVGHTIGDIIMMVLFR